MPSFVRKTDVRFTPNPIDPNRFAAPPRLSKSKIWWLSRAAVRAGRSDGRAGSPAIDDTSLPSAVKRLVEDANAFMGERVTPRFVGERNRLHDLQNQIEAAANERKLAIASLSDVPEPAVPPEPAAKIYAPPGSEAPQKTVTAAAPDKKPQKTAATRDFSAVRASGQVTYLLVLALIFIGEAVVNKKAFELFSEADRTLWLMVTGVSIAVVAAAHLLGKFWKRFSEEGRDKSVMVFLALIALAGAVMLGSMRHLAVDRERQDQIALLQNQKQSAQVDRARNVQRQRALLRLTKPRPSQREELLLAKSRIAGADALLAASNARLRETQTLQGVERPLIAVPLFIFVNLFLIGVATALAYHHADPAAERERAQDKGRRRRERRERFNLWLGATFGRWGQRRDAKRLRKELARSEEKLAKAQQSTQMSEQARLSQILNLQREVEQLRASYKTAERTLQELQKTYCAACEGIEFAYRAIAERYWTIQNENAQRPLKELRDAWEKGRRRALKKGLPLPDKPEGLDWRQPAAQRTPLRFVRPGELGCSDIQQGTQ